MDEKPKPEDIEKAYREGRISRETYEELMSRFKSSPTGFKLKSSGGMSMKTILAVSLIVVAVVAVGAWYVLTHQGGPTPTETPPPTTKHPKPPKTSKPPKTTHPPTTTPPATTPPGSPPQTTQPPGGNEISGSQLFQLGKVKHYKYKMTMTSQGTTYDISTDTVNGKECWLFTTTVEQQGMSMTYKIWYDKATMQCVKARMEVAGMMQDVPCAQVQQSTGGGQPKSDVKLTYVGTETVTVPAGTFQCLVYRVTTQGTTSTYYIAPDVPVPVKWVIESQSGSVTAELVEYQT